MATRKGSWSIHEKSSACQTSLYVLMYLWARVATKSLQAYTCFLEKVIISLQSNSQVYIHWIEVFFIQLLVEHLEMEMGIEIHRAVEMGLQHVPNSLLDGKSSFLLELDLPQAVAQRNTNVKIWATWTAPNKCQLLWKARNEWSFTFSSEFVHSVCFISFLNHFHFCFHHFPSLSHTSLSYGW